MRIVRAYVNMEDAAAPSAKHAQTIEKIERFFQNGTGDSITLHGLELKRSFEGVYFEYQYPDFSSPMAVAEQWDLSIRRVQLTEEQQFHVVLQSGLRRYELDSDGITGAIAFVSADKPGLVRIIVVAPTLEMAETILELINAGEVPLLPA